MAKRAWWIRLVCMALMVIICMPSAVQLSHSHDGDAHLCMSCVVCTAAQRLQSLLVQLFFALLVLGVWQAVCAQGIRQAAEHPSGPHAPTLVALKIRMNN